MVKNERGFTIPELLAVIIITSVIIIPLMTSMIDNIKTNNILHTRRSSVSIADGTLYGFDKLDYYDLEAIQDNSNSVVGDYYSEFNSSTCDQLSDPDDITICSALFGAQFNSVSFDNTHFRVFIYDYNLSAARQTSLESNNNIPQEVRDEISALTTSTAANPGLLRISVWIQYSDDPVRSIIVSGLVIGDWSGN